MKKLTILILLFMTSGWILNGQKNVSNIAAIVGHPDDCNCNFTETAFLLNQISHRATIFDIAEGGLMLPVSQINALSRHTSVATGTARFVFGCLDGLGGRVGIRSEKVDGYDYND